MKICIFIPAYYAERTIKEVVSKIPKEIFDNEVEILILDDASQDRTYQNALELKKEMNERNITVIKNSKNLGYGGNQKKAYNYCINKNYDLVVMLHGDMQYPAEKIPELIEPIKNGEADLVIGSRISGTPLKGGMPFWKFVSNKFLTFLENKSFNLNLSEYHTGFRAYNIHILKQIDFNKSSDNYIFDQQIIAQLNKKTKKIREITIPTYYGPGSHKISFLKSVRYGLGILKMLYIKKEHKL